MPYAILRFEKRKGGAMAALEKHHERKKEKYKSNPDIDLSKTYLNYHIVSPRQSYKKEIDKRIEDAGARVRKDSVKFIDTIITASPEFFDAHNIKDRKKYFDMATEFIMNEVGEENIFSATVHMDEKTPHMHLCFVPLTKDGRLSAKEIIGNRTKLSEWQDKFYEYMSAEFPKLDRGEPADETKRKHIPMRLFKMATQLDADMEKIKTEIESVNNFNAVKKREKVLDMLAKWCYKANSFDKQIIQLKTTLEIEKDNNQYYKKQMERAQVRNNILENENIDLLQSQQEMREFIESIPKDLRAELIERFEEQQAFNQAEYLNQE